LKNNIDNLIYNGDMTKGEVGQPHWNLNNPLFLGGKNGKRTAR